MVIGKVELQVDYYDRPEKLKRADMKNLKEVQMLPEQIKKKEEDRIKREAMIKERKQKDPNASITSETDGPDFTEFVSDTDDLLYEEDPNDPTE